MYSRNFQGAEEISTQEPDMKNQNQQQDLIFRNPFRLRHTAAHYIYQRARAGTQKKKMRYTPKLHISQTDLPTEKSAQLCITANLMYRMK